MASKFLRDLIARRIAGDIVWSNEPGTAMRKWREIFKASQIEVASLMSVAPSVVSDYEKGRRQPGSRFIRKFVESLLSIDEARGWLIAKSLARTLGIGLEAVIDMVELNSGILVDELITAVKGMILTPDIPRRKVYGYTILDSISAIESLTGNEFYHLMGITTERALIFTRVTAGRSPMIAVRVSPLKPPVVILHGPRRHIDKLAIRLADKERVLLAVSLHETVDNLTKSLRMIVKEI